MKLSQIEELENRLEHEFNSIFGTLQRLDNYVYDFDLSIRTDGIKSNVQAAFEDIKSQLEDLKLQAIRKD